MNKKFIVFILILSFLCPLLPVFHFNVSAAESVSENDPNPFQNDVMRYFADRLIRDGYVVRDFDDLVAGYLQAFGYISQGTDTLENQIHEFNQNVANGLFTTDDVKNDSNIQNSINQYVNDNLNYYIYDFININDFFTYYQFNNYPSDSSYPGVNSYKLALENACSDNNYVYFLSSTADDYNSVQYLYATTLIKVPREFFDNNYLVLSSGQFSSIKDYQYQSFRVPRDGDSVPTFTNFNISNLGFYDGLSFITSDTDFSFRRFYGNSSGNYYQGNEVLLTVPNYRIFTGLINNSSSWFSSGSFNGTAFIYCGESFSTLVFRSANLCQDFISGNADVYKFTPNVDIPSGANIDYSRLFEEIEHAIQENSGNLIDTINNAANNYLDRIANSLDDTKEIVQGIYNQLESHLPQFLVYLQNLSLNTDITNDVLKDIDDKLGFLIEMPLEDATAEDFEDIRNLCANKFPFCIFSDIVAISVILNRPPVEPDINIPFPIGSESMNSVHIDLEPYEYVRPYVHAGIIFLFIIGLIALSIKVFESVKS